MRRCKRCSGKIAGRCGKFPFAASAWLAAARCGSAAPFRRRLAFVSRAGRDFHPRGSDAPFCGFEAGRLDLRAANPSEACFVSAGCKTASAAIGCCYSSETRGISTGSETQGLRCSINGQSETRDKSAGSETGGPVFGLRPGPFLFRNRPKKGFALHRPRALRRLIWSPRA